MKIRVVFYKRYFYFRRLYLTGMDVELPVHPAIGETIQLYFGHHIPHCVNHVCGGHDVVQAKVERVFHTPRLSEFQHSALVEVHVVVSRS